MAGIAQPWRASIRSVARAVLLLALTVAVAASVDPVLPPLVDDGAGTPEGAFLGQLTDRTGYANRVGADGRLDPTVLLRHLPAKAIAEIRISGLGGGLWQHRADGGPTANWAAALIRDGVGSQAYVVFSTPGDAYPRYDLELLFADGARATVGVDGGPVDANRWTEAYQGAPEWRGAVDSDLTGFRKGPDGVRDDEIRLAALYPGLAVERVTLTRGSRRWSTGPMTTIDEGNADLVDVAPGRASLRFRDDVFGSGRYEITVRYQGGPVLACAVDASQPSPPSALVDSMPPTPAPIATVVAWHGQDPGTGLVTIGVRGPGTTGSLVLAEVTDGATGVWRALGPEASAHAALVPGTDAAPLMVASDSTRGRTLSFLPSSDLRGRRLSVRVVALEGATLVHALGAVAGGTTDPAAGQPAPVASAVVARPGDDLAALALVHGRIELAPGDHVRTAPLRLTRPVTISGPRDARLLFSQPAGDAPWSRAVDLGAGRTTLSGFTIAFAGPVRFAPEDVVSYGSAVVGTSLDRPVDRRAALRLEDLAISGPPAASDWERAVHLVVMKDSSGGALIGNVLRGGTVRLLGGPWEVLGNVHHGALANTFAFEAFAGHFLHDLVFTGNRLEVDAAVRARTWRFLVMTAFGYHGTVTDNSVVGVGERSDDAARGIPFENAPEVILTEAYHTVFEGVPSSVSSDGRLLRIPGVLAGRLSERAAVAILDGPQAGTWRRIRHVVNARECLVDPPMPTGTPPTVAISDAGFMDFAFERNRIDLRGNAPPLQGDPTGLVLAGNHYGTRVTGNTFLGGRPAHIVSAPTEHQPFRWGWGYAPVLGLVFSGNVCEDAAVVRLGPEHSAAIKGGAARTYFSADIIGNRFSYSDAWLAAHPGAQTALTVGSAGTIDPVESRIRWSGNAAQRADGGAVEAAAVIRAITADGTVLDGMTMPLPPPPAAGDGGGGTSSSGGCGDGAAAALGLLSAVFARVRSSRAPAGGGSHPRR